MLKTLASLATLWLTGLPLAQDAPVFQTDFPPEEFKARRAKVYDRIGDKAVAVM